MHPKDTWAARKRPLEHMSQEISAEIERVQARRLEGPTISQERYSTASSLKHATVKKEDTLTDDWQEKEQAFLLEQRYQKAFRRIKESRGDPLDKLMVNTFRQALVVSLGHLSGVDEAYWNEVCQEDPIDLLDSLTDSEKLNQARKDVNGIIGLEKDSECKSFWTLILAYIDLPHKSTTGMDPDILAMLAPKTLDQLGTLRDKIRKNSDQLFSDPEYREQVLECITFRRLCLRIRTTYQKFLSNRLEQMIKQESFSVSDPQKTVENVCKVPSVSNLDNSQAALGLFQSELARPRGEEELPFMDEFPVPNAGNLFGFGGILLLKPRYVARARYTYEWNRYNQTHYDSEHPPPKSVQGYRFTIIYPQLSRGTVPTYSLKKLKMVEGEGDRKWALPPPDPVTNIIPPTSYALLTFTCNNVVYEDLCFKIADIEWDTHPKHGFRCVYDRGILRLNFWFVKARFRKY